MGILEIDGLSLELDGNRILNNLSLDFWEGHVHAVVGPNGAGKSTLAMTIMGLEGYRGHAGDIRFKGDSIRDLTIDERAKRGITLAWQEPARFEGVGVRAFIGAGRPAASPKEIDSFLELVGLDPGRYGERKVDKTLSGGERKRIELASIAIMRPAVVLMDEPDSGVDIEAVNHIFRVIDRLKEQGSTIILITHSAEVLKRADHGFLLCHGHLMDKGPTEKMLAYFSGKCIPCSHRNAPEQSELFAFKGAGKGAAQ